MMMKFRLLMIALFITACIPVDACCHAIDVPSAIMQNFNSLFPQANGVEWTKQRSNFRADFLYNSMTVSVTFHHSGQIIKAVNEIRFDQLPQIIIQMVRRDYPEYKELIVLERYNNHKLEYEVELMKGSFHFALKFNSKGRLIGKSYVDKTYNDDFVWL
jgi:hypothetical protein